MTRPLCITNGSISLATQLNRPFVCTSSNTYRGTSAHLNQVVGSVVSWIVAPCSVDIWAMNPSGLDGRHTRLPTYMQCPSYVCLSRYCTCMVKPIGYPGVGQAVFIN